MRPTPYGNNIFRNAAGGGVSGLAITSGRWTLVSSMRGLVVARDLVRGMVRTRSVGFSRKAWDRSAWKADNQVRIAENVMPHDCGIGIGAMFFAVRWCEAAPLDARP